MKTQTLKIDLIDDTVEIKRDQMGPAKDYIGTARVPLSVFNLDSNKEQDLQQFFPVLDA